MRSRLVRSVIGSAGIQAASRGLSLVLGIMLARTLGPEGYGVYAFAFAMMSVLMILANVGVPTLLMREVAAAEGRGAWGLLRGALQRGIQMVALVSITIAVLGFFVLALFSDALAPENRYTIGVMLLVLPAAALCTTYAHGLRGLYKVLMAQMLELILWPSLVILLVGSLFFFRPDLLTPWAAMAAHLVAVVTVVIIAALLLRTNLPGKVRLVPAEFESKRWLRMTPQFVILSAALVVNTQIDMLMLGWFTSAHDLGLYRVATQSAVLVIFGLQAVSVVVSPQIARIHAQNDVSHLQRLVTRSAQAMTIPAVLVALVLFFEGHALLAWLFSSDFSGAYVPMMILAVGQLASAAFGISGPLLTMTGYERIQSRLIWGAVGLNVVMNLVFIPWLGMNGAAISTAFTLIGWTFCLAWISHRRLYINVSPFRWNS
jgi:O-antigen/teichoic acid export membrane protein